MMVDDMIFTTTIDRSGGRPKQGNGHHHIRVSRCTDVLSRNLQVSPCVMASEQGTKLLPVTIFPMVIGGFE